MFLANPELLHAIERARKEEASFTEHELSFVTPGGIEVELSLSATPVDLAPYVMALEFHMTTSHSRILREERMLNLGKANQVLLRNFAHEVKNPLGGLRGAAQLLERELPAKPARVYPGHYSGGRSSAIPGGAHADSASPAPDSAHQHP